MQQLTLATTGFERYAKTTRQVAFLAEMERVVPWPALCELIEPFYPKPGNGRPPVGVARMLRIYFLQHWFNLSDPAVEEALYDSLAMRRFVGIDLGREPVPDETTMCRFRHLLEAHDLGRRLFDEVKATPSSLDSPLEGAGFEPPVPAPRSLIGSCSTHAGFCLRRRPERMSSSCSSTSK